MPIWKGKLEGISHALFPKGGAKKVFHLSRYVVNDYHIIYCELKD